MQLRCDVARRQAFAGETQHLALAVVERVGFRPGVDGELWIDRASAAMHLTDRFGELLGFGALGIGFTFFGWGVGLAITSVWVAPMLTARLRRTTVLKIALPLLALDLFAAALRPGTPLIHQPTAVADALERYLSAHPEYDPGTDGRREFLTTGEPGPQNALVQAFWGAPLRFEAA